MSAARSEYVRLCSEHHVKPLKAVLKQLPDNNARGLECIKVDLSGVNLSVKMCAVLGKVLQRDRSILALHVADCYISEEGCLALLAYLADNTTLKGLSLKGNNLRTKSASALSTVLKRNKVIESLSLEWNSLGTDEDAFAMLMDGLAINETLAHLDLRNNHITHIGARHLATALVQNHTVQEIDLSWNNCGLVGGRFLLDCLQHNRSLAVMDLTGNSIPEDVASAISVGLQRNVDRHQLESTYSSQTQRLTNALDQEMVTKKKEISAMIDKLESQRSAFDATLESSQERIVELQRDVTLRSEEIAALQARYITCEASLHVSQQQCAQFKSLAGQLQAELSEARDAHLEELKMEKQKFADFQSEASAAATKASDEADTLCAKIAELERSRKQLTIEVEGLQDDKQNLQLRIQKMDNEFQSQRLLMEQRQTAVLQAQQQQSQEEVGRLRHAAAGREHGLQDQIRQAETKCAHMEQELARLKSSNLSTRESLVADQKAQLEQVKNEHKLNVRHLEERIQQLQVELDTKQTHVIQASSSANQVQARLTALTQETASEQQSLRKQIKKLEAQAEEGQKAADTDRQARRDLQNHADQLQERCHQFEQEIGRCKARQSELETQHLTTVSAKDREIANLTGRLDSLNQQLQRQRDAELKRAGQLESALAAFVSSTKSANL